MTDVTNTPTATVDLPSENQTATRPVDSRFLSCAKEETPSVFLQYKNTDACFDFYCRCGAHCHFDGAGAAVVKCPHCLRTYRMPSSLTPVEVVVDSDESPALLEPDEDWVADSEEKV